MKKLPSDIRIKAGGSGKRWFLPRGKIFFFFTKRVCQFVQLNLLRNNVFQLHS